MRFLCNSNRRRLAWIPVRPLMPLDPVTHPRGSRSEGVSRQVMTWVTLRIALGACGMSGIPQPAAARPSSTRERLTRSALGGSPLTEARHYTVRVRRGTANRSDVISCLRPDRRNLFAAVTLVNDPLYHVSGACKLQDIARTDAPAKPDCGDLGAGQRCISSAPRPSAEQTTNSTNRRMPDETASVR